MQERIPWGRFVLRAEWLFGCPQSHDRDFGRAISIFPLFRKEDLPVIAFGFNREWIVVGGRLLGHVTTRFAVLE